MRVVLRQSDSGLYLQPSGEWSPDRETAREFLSAVVAYWWSVEQDLMADVWMVLKDPTDDFACMRAQSGRTRPLINCRHEDWSHSLHSFLYNSIEVDLMNFD